MEVNDLIKKLLKEVHTISTTETVVGEALQVGKSKLIPISKLSIGFGVGGISSSAGEAEQGDDGLDESGSAPKA